MTRQRRLIVLAALCAGFAVTWQLRDREAPALTPKPASRPAAAARRVVIPETPSLTRVTQPQAHPDGAEQLSSRDPAEWQGMRVDLARQATCDTSARCGLAMACHAGRCGPCAADSECGDDEVCSLEHCVRRDLATCRTRADCGDSADQLCVLSGYSNDPRGNAELAARCRGPSGGQEQPAEAPVRVVAAAPRPPVDVEELQRSLH